MSKSKRHEEVIAETLVELDRDHSMYQKLYERYYGKQDAQAQNIHGLLVDLCDKIRKRINAPERK